MSGSQDIGTGIGAAGEAGLQTRLDALAEYDILDTAAEAGFDDVVLVAAHVCAVPVALVSLVARDRQWFKAKVGLDADGTPIAQSVCAHALTQGSLLVIPDLTQDPRTCANPLVTGEAGLRFYAGAPLVTPAGVAIGTVCVIDRVPRPGGLTPEQGVVLDALARQVIAQLELRRLLRAREDISVRERRAGARNLARAVATEEENIALRANDMRSRFAQEAGRIGTFELDIATGTMTVSPEFCRLYGLPVASSYPAATLDALVVAEDGAFRSDTGPRADGDAALETEYRIRRSGDGNLRWIARRAEFVVGASGNPAKMFGAVHDVTERKRVDAHKTALIELGDRLRDVSTREEAAAIASSILGRTLGVSRAGYGRVDQKAERLEIDRDWTMSDIPSIVGRHPLAALQSTVDLLCRGETIVITDIPSAPSFQADAATYARIGVRAQIKVPLLERGELVGLVFAHQADGRAWRLDEVEFAKGVADRTHLALGKIQADADQETLNHELSHRLKNTLAMVQAIATQTLRGVPGREPVEAFEKRLHALSRAHDVLLQQSWAAAPMGSLVRSAFDAFAQAERFDVSGPDLSLAPRPALSLALLLHELATNAVKHGALSNETGRVSVTWRLDPAAEDDVLVFVWTETGGPPAREPDRKGFGSRLIRMGLVGTGGVELRYLPEGFVAEMRASLAHMRQT